MRTSSSRGWQQTVFDTVQAFPRRLSQGRIGTDNLANHLPSRQIESAFGRRPHRQRHRTLRTKADALRWRFLSRFHSGRLSEHEHGHGFLSGLEFAITAKTIKVLQTVESPVRVVSYQLSVIRKNQKPFLKTENRELRTLQRYSLQPAADGTSMQKDSRSTRLLARTKLCSSQMLTASRTLMTMGTGSAAKVSRSKTSTQRQQVAAVCYRIRGSHLEFLLVQTRGGRWIFPKGGVEPGHTHAESAALEAFEEAGVHGRIEKIPFTRYFHRKPDQPLAQEPAVSAHLCEVLHLERPQEANRHPSWFSTEKAKQRLRKDRASELGAELLRVVDKAAARIQRLHSANPAPPHAHIDPLRKVRFEAHEDPRFYDSLRQAVLARYLLPRSQLRLGSGETRNTADASRNVTPIDRATSIAEAKLQPRKGGIR
jgi:8-oxo-dGTP pyrophosphatase MutT (NUDIX family)